MKFLLRALVKFSVLLILAIFSLWLGVRSPAVSVAPERGGQLANVTLIEPGAGRREGMTITIDGGLISSIEPTDSDTIDDYSENFVIPGLIDMHVHQPLSFAGFEEYFSLLYLLHGVTSVRDTGYSYPSVFNRRASIKDGEYPGHLYLWANTGRKPTVMGKRSGCRLA